MSKLKQRGEQQICSGYTRLSIKLCVILILVFFSIWQFWGFIYVPFLKVSQQNSASAGHRQLQQPDFTSASSPLYFSCISQERRTEGGKSHFHFLSFYCHVSFSDNLYLWSIFDKINLLSQPPPTLMCFWRSHMQMCRLHAELHPSHH